jgi:hypothetical protein
MKRPSTLLLALVLSALALPTFAGNVGSPLPTPELEGMAQTQAKSFDDFLGRAVLIEFFAYW